jgi:class 3 adenylate cyclase
MGEVAKIAEQIIAVFRDDDERGTGVVSVFKLKEVCRFLGHEEATITSVLHDYRDECGHTASGIDYAEFVMWLLYGNSPDKIQASPAASSRKTVLGQHVTKSKQLWHNVAGSEFGKKRLSDAVLEAHAVSQEGGRLSLEASTYESPDERARSYLRFSPALLHYCLLQEEFSESLIDHAVVNHFEMALLLIDVSGFTRMSQRLGAERTRKHTSEFFDQIIQCITSYSGDVLKFLGDALLVVWPVICDAHIDEQKHVAAAAAACAAEVMRTLDGYQISDDICLTLHGGLSFGHIHAFDVGNALRREFLVGGSVLVELGDLTGDASSGELVMSSEMFNLLPEGATGKTLASGSVRLDLESVATSMKGKVKTLLSDNLALQFSLLETQSDFAPRFEKLLEAHVPPTCREYAHNFALGSLGEMRHVTTLFLSLDALVPHLNMGRISVVQVAFSVIIEAAKFTGGAIRQFVLDDKGCVAILAWGLPRAAYGYGQDATRAIACAFHSLHGLEDLLAAEGVLIDGAAAPHVGIAAGQAYVGLIGATQRCEYAMVGPSVNLAARLMNKAEPDQVLVEETVHDNALNADSTWKFLPQPPVKAKGYDHLVAVFVPEQEARQRIGASKNLVDEFTQVWSRSDLRTQMVGKIASVLADGPEGAVEFHWLALVHVVGALQVATYAEAKKARSSLQATGYFRFRRTEQRGNEKCSFTVADVQKWVLNLLTTEYQAEVREFLEKYNSRKKRASVETVESSTVGPQSTVQTVQSTNSQKL